MMQLNGILWLDDRIVSTKRDENTFANIVKEVPVNSLYPAEYFNLSLTYHSK